MPGCSFRPRAGSHKPLLSQCRSSNENGVPVAGVEVTLEETGQISQPQRTDYAGQCTVFRSGRALWPARGKTRLLPGALKRARSCVLQREDRDRARADRAEEVNVTASAPGIDTTDVTGEIAMNTPEIVDIPYPTSRDIRNLLPFNPGVVQDVTGQIHIAGSETWETLDTIDGFDVRSPVNGTLDMRVSADAVRTIETETTRYPVEFGRATGGVIAFYTGMGDNKFRFNATNFVPSFREQQRNSLR